VRELLWLASMVSGLATPSLNASVQAVEIVPQYTDAQALLAAVCRRLGQNEEAMRAAVQAIISPPCLGTRPVQLLRWLQSLAKAPEDLERDPIWRARQRLRLVFGGAQSNDDYAAMEAGSAPVIAGRVAVRLLGAAYQRRSVRIVSSFCHGMPSGLTRSEDSLVARSSSC